MLESRSTRKESPAAPSHIEAASDLARRRTRSVRDAEDVVQEAYLRAVRSFDGFHRDNARGWALAIRRNAWFTGWQRRRQMADGAPCDDALHGEQRLHGWPDDTGSDPQNFSVRRDGIHLPRQMPGAQSVEHRESVVLLDLEGMSDRENATVIDAGRPDQLAALAGSGAGFCSCPSSTGGIAAQTRRRILRPFGRLGQSISGASIRSIRIRPGRERIFLLARSTRQPDQSARHPERLHRRPSAHDVDDTPSRPPTRHSGTATKYGRRSGAGGNGLIHPIELGVGAIIGNYHV
ncbi:Sigma-70 region 2 [Burkholderia sp. GAS332]|nr:Sigma-70 region 2 [Burkholderia sp. GAS332]